MRSIAWVLVLAGCGAGEGGGASDAAVGAGGAGGVGGAGGAGGASPEVPEGAPCNLGPDGACEGGLACSTLGRCVAPNPPVISRASLHRGTGVIFIEVEVADGERDAETLHIAIGGVEHTLRLNLTVAPTVPVSTRWLTRASGDAEVWAMDRSGLASERVRVAVADIPIAPTGSPCDPAGLASWCGEGALCLEWDGTGRCFAVETHLWPRNEGVMVDITADTEPEWTAGEFTVGDRLASPWYTEGRTGWRWTGFVPVLEGAPEVRHRGHLVAGGLVVESQPERAEGERCDSERLADVCTAGTACRFSVCEPVEAPVLEGFSAFAGEGHVGFVATGSDPDRDLEGFRLGEVPGLFAADQDGRTSGAVVWDGDRFTAWWSGPHDGAAAIRLVLVDAEGLESRPGDARVGPAAPEPVAGDGLCDLSGLLFTCAADRTCTRTDADAVPRCRRPDAACPGGVATDFNDSGTLVGAPDHTEVTCGDGWGPDARHLFTAPAAGRYRFTLTPDGFYAYLALRRSCTQRAEVGCARSLEGPAVLEADLAAGETITAVVELAICRCNPGPYTLDVERLE